MDVKHLTPNQSAILATLLTQIAYEPTAIVALISDPANVLQNAGLSKDDVEDVIAYLQQVAKLASDAGSGESDWWK